MDYGAEFLDVVKPLYILSSLFCIRKYSIRDAMLFPVGPIEMSLTICANFLLVCLFYVTFQSTEFTELSLKLHYITIYGQHLITFIVISYHNIRLSKLYVALMKSLQEIYCFEGIQVSSKALKKRLKITCGVLICLFIVVIVPKLALDPYWNWARAVFFGFTIVIDFELVFIIFVIRLLALKFKVWSEVANKLSTETNNISDSDDTDTHINTESVIDVEDTEDSPELEEIHDIEESRHEDIQVDTSDKAKKLFEVFNKLVNATNLMKSAFQFTIFYHAFTLFTKSLLYIAVLIMWIKFAEHDFQIGKVVLISHSAGIIIWIVKALVLQALVGSSMEGLYSAARASRSAACVMVARHDVTMSRYAKNALRVSDSRFHRFTAAGALFVDAALPLRLAALVGSYTVVLLQFAFLQKEK